MAERKDKIKNQSEVIKALVKDPTLTEREVAKEAWISNWSAHNHIKEIEQNWAESKIMDRILQMDDQIMELANQITLREINKKIENWKELTLNETKIIWDLANNSTKRKAIFDKWDQWDDDRTINLVI